MPSFISRTYLFTSCESFHFVFGNQSFLCRNLSTYIHMASERQLLHRKVMKWNKAKIVGNSIAFNALKGFTIVKKGKRKKENFVVFPLKLYTWTLSNSKQSSCSNWVRSSKWLNGQPSSMLRFCFRVRPDGNSIDTFHQMWLVHHHWECFVSLGNVRWVFNWNWIVCRIQCDLVAMNIWWVVWE